MSTAVAPNKSNAPANSAKPQAPKEAKKAPQKRIEHPLTASKDTNVYPFTTAPADFNRKLHLPFRKKDFKELHQYYAWRLSLAEAAVTRARQQMEEAKLGGGSAAAASKRMGRMLAKIAEKNQELSAQGVDMSAIFRSQNIDIEALQKMIDAARAGQTAKTA